MGMAPRLSELRSMSDEELVRKYDGAAQHTVVGTAYYMDEIHRRQVERQNETMISLTRSINRLTWVIAGVTVIAILIAAASLVMNLLGGRL